MNRTMYSKEELQTIFQSAFSADTWQAMLCNLFGARELRQAPGELLDVSTETETAYYLGKLSAPDAEIGLFYFRLNRGSVVHRRVGLRNLVKTFTNPRWGVFDAALAVFDDGVAWRVSLISDIKGEETSPKRFTFVFGNETQHYHTAIERFTKLLTDGVSFKALMDAFSVETLTKEFYKELFDWYQWALSEGMGIAYPNNTGTDSDNLVIQEHLIRLITRLIFVWFIKQKKLIPEDIFDITKLQGILRNFDPTSAREGDYYNAILQNLFFATLNRPISERMFASHSTAGTSDGKEHYGIKTLFRDDNQETWFLKSHEEVIDLFRQVPFLNGGLFECLDKEENDNDTVYYFDGFSRDARNKEEMLIRTFIPNRLFFDKDNGLISILKRYNFTIEENTPNEVDVALDPELLGKVFENLLGAYNPETKETARKQSGSFYTPREIVNYMVDESLIAYLKQTVGEEYENEYRNLLIGDSDASNTLKSQIYNALRNCKILDPACGSGAFPMGILNGIICMMEHLGLPSHISIFDLKLHLIENCIFGIDIQNIAVQISKLRFFISLIVEQTPTEDVGDNYGIKPLPNLETKFVAANTLMGIKKKKEGDFVANLFEDPQIEVAKRSLLEVRHEHFSAYTAKKKKDCRMKDKELREKLARLLEENNEFAPDDARQLAAWNPYDQNTSSPFFDEEWMFGFTQGFDIVIGNPPYVQLQNKGGELAEKYSYSKAEQKEKKQESPYKTFARTGDLYCLFYERGYQLLKPQGRLCFITSNKWMRAGYGMNTRKFFVENTNPEQLIDFAGVKVFESATVDTNILMFSKDKNRQKTKACVVKREDKERIKELSVFVRQNASVCSFSADSWVVLSPIEQRIKAKIEAVGIPLRDWDINIYRGILTGYNEAFIIGEEKKDELIAEDPKSAEIIRPLLRGRDIKRYGYEFADLYLITTFPSLKIDIEQYPAVKQHLMSFGYDRLKQTGEPGARKKTNNQWFETQDTIGYWEDFSKQKIVYIEIMTDNPDDGYDFPSFSFDEQDCVLLNTAYMMSGDSDDLKYVLAILNSKFGRQLVKFYVTQLQNRQFRMLHQSVTKFPIPKISVEEKDIFIRLVEAILANEHSVKQQNELNVLVYHLFALSEEEIQFIESQ